MTQVWSGEVRGGQDFKMDVKWDFRGNNKEYFMESKVFRKRMSQK